LDEYRDRKSMIACATLREAHVRRLGMPYLTAGIERYGRLASCCGVEQREPLLDKRVIDLCVSLPWRQLVRDGWSKFGLRCVAQRILPQEVAWRPGWDEVMWKFWSAWGVISEEHVRAVLSEIPAEVEEMLDRKKFNQRLNRYKIGDDSDRESILNLTYLVQWLNTIQKFG
jgi:asparagine synthase (glutamine-hydrolysing)